MVKNLPAMWEIQVRSLGQEDAWRREWLPTLVFLPGESYGQRSLEVYSPWSCKESDMTELLTYIHTHTHTHTLTHTHTNTHTHPCFLDWKKS